MMKLGFSKSDSGSIQGNWNVKVRSSGNVIIDGYVVDISQAWSGPTHWKSHISDETTVTFPSTADSIISVGAYAVNYGWDEKVNEKPWCNRFKS